MLVVLLNSVRDPDGSRTSIATSFPTRQGGAGEGYPHHEGTIQHVKAEDEAAVCSFTSLSQNALPDSYLAFTIQDARSQG